MLKEGAGRQIQEARERAGLSQMDLATETKVSIYTISSIETGRNTTPRRRTIYSLCKAVGLDPDTVLSPTESVATT